MVMKEGLREHWCYVARQYMAYEQDLICVYCGKNLGVALFHGHDNTGDRVLCSACFNELEADQWC